MAKVASLSRRLGWTARMIRDGAAQRRLPFVPADTLRRLQDHRVGEAVRYAHTHVPYYRETMRKLGLGPAEFRTASDLARLPLLEREHVQRDPEYFLSDQWAPERCVTLASGGTTGAPLTVFRDPPSLFAAAAHRERMRSLVLRLAGRRIRYREAQIRLEDSSFATAVSAFSRETMLPVGVRVQRRVFSRLQSPAELWLELDRFRPDVVTAYGSYLEEMFALIRRTGMQVALPRVVSYGADSMSAEMQHYIQRELGIHVLGSYSSVETPQIGFECERHRGFHLNVDLCPVRLLDSSGQEVNDELPGQAVVSNLVNRATVLLNYCLGDELRRLAGPCPCGRTLPMCSYLGRTKLSWLSLGSGQKIHAQELRLVLRGERDVWRYQIVQEADRRFRVLLVPGPACDRQSASTRIRRRFQEQLGDRAEVEIEFIQDLPRPPGGKIQPVVALDRFA